MPDLRDSDLSEPTTTRSGDMSIAIEFSKEQAAQMAQERPQQFLCPRCAAASENAIDSFDDD
jgi:hypothetical protein